MASTEDRIVNLEQEFRIADYKLDTLIDSVKAVTSAVKDLAEVSNKQTLITERMNQIFQEQASIKTAMKERRAITDPIIEKGKSYMTAVKTWGTIGSILIIVAQSVILNVADRATVVADRTEARVVTLERSLDVLKSRVDEQRKVESKEKGL